MGKTQLIYHAYADESIKDKFYAFYIDILPSTSLREFTFLLSKEIYKTLVPAGGKALNLFLSTLKSIKGVISNDFEECKPKFEIQLGDINAPELTLEEIFNYLQNADRPCVCTIDEFQQIGNYPENNVEALLRSYVQKTGNCVFVFAGSDRHTLENMFNSPAKPFYNSVDHMFLDRIDRDVYIAFVQQMFEEAGRKITDSACRYLYDIFEGHTYYVHQTLHDVFANIDANKIIEEDDIDSVISDIIENREHSFIMQMFYLNLIQKETLIAIAKEVQAHEVTSVAFVKKYSLQSPGTVQNAIRNLLKLQILTYRQEGKKKVYSVSDRFFQIWLKTKY